MSRVISFGEVLVIQAGVNLGGTDVGVPQHFLYRVQVTAGLQHVAGKGVPQHMWVHWGADARLQAARAQALPNRL